MYLRVEKPEATQVYLPSQEWYVIKTDVEIGEVRDCGGKPGCPGVFTCGDMDRWKDTSHATIVNEKYQWFWFDVQWMECFGWGIGNLDQLMDMGKYCYPEDEFRGMEQAFTGIGGSALWAMNKKGFPGRKNFISGEDLDLPFPELDKVRVLASDAITGGIAISPEKKRFIEVPWFDYSKDPPDTWDWSMTQDPRFMRGTVVYTNGVTGNFPPRGSMPQYSLTVVPRIAKRQTYYPEWLTRKVFGPRPRPGYPTPF